LADQRSNELLRIWKDAIAHGERPSQYNIVPYRIYSVADVHFVLEVGSDVQFERWCNLVNRRDLFERFPTNAQRVQNRAAVDSEVELIMKGWPREKWDLELAKIGVPGGPVNNLDEVFSHPQIKHRQGRVSIPRSGVKGGRIDVLGNPVRFSASPVEYRYPPPFLGEHTADISSQLDGRNHSAGPSET
jgi:crotonobetainyl-CoA:carnitine CoA-transferase CaiB-like acyl-CoA transferase